MQRYNPMTKCLETVKTTDSKKKRTRDFKTNDTIKRIKVSELKEGQTIVKTGEVVKNLKEDGDKIIVTAKRVLAHGASPSIYKLAKNSTIQVSDNKTVDAVRFSIRKYEHHYREFGYAIYDNKVKGFLAKDKKIVYFDTKEEAKKWLTNILNKNGMKNVL